ncbi:Uncharacterised protein [Zhongshania aliphaticivorans]|uniref:Porin domain-containing protein n=1 Tax=Zhongshania aliphaticivorans TaxID=1470434 RepID=A0A5S9MS09_9GAMM|nr:putative porin [Zhongshania aliphaticivorans]CAA0078223.1 Uncharacterised protein [Zhongshania aliphaticivorans]CAA0086868.1 Uncharacterised protein [Zhongshania aliphaticivorans]
MLLNNYGRMVHGLVLGFLALMVSGASVAGAEISAGVWWVYQNASEGDGDGEFADPALIIYGDDDGSHGPWGFSAEMRIGTGSFTNPASNNSGDNFTMHKAWISYQLDEHHKVTVGKSQVPFGWKTSNFWPGDMLQGGYGDQMDIGAKLTGQSAGIHYDIAYYTQDDWGKTSTDTVDDNGHWGSAASGAETYRKGETLVVNADLPFAGGHTIGISLQQGRLEDLTAFAANDSTSDDGEHRAVDLHYYYTYNNVTFKYRFIDVMRDFTELDACVAALRCPNGEVENQRHAAHIDYKKDNWLFYLEATAAESQTTGNPAGRVKAFAPGMSYNYGPGWLYLEYLWQDGFINSFGDVGEGDFRSLYLSFDFYF